MHIRRLRLALLLLLLPFLAACGGAYELTVEFEGEADVKPDSPVYVDGVQVGYVSSVDSSKKKTDVGIVIKEDDVVDRRMKQGVVPYPKGDGGVEIDTSNIDEEADSIPSGSRVIGYTKSKAMLVIYGTPQTVIFAIAAILALCLLIWAFRAFFKLGAVVLVLLLAGGVSWYFHPVVMPLVESLSKKILGGTEAAAKIPDPKWTAFLVLWFVAFLVLQIAFGFTFRLGRKK